MAANLLKGGTTVHRSFRSPLTLSEDTTCGWTMQSTQTKNIGDEVALIIWDEAPMTPRFAMEAVNRHLIDIKRRIEPMGGKSVLFGGDFRQILPVVLGSPRNDIIAQSLKASELWHSFTRLQLTKNMRVAHHPEITVPHDDLDKCTFGQWLLKLGERMITFIKLNQRAAPVAQDDLIEIPTRFQVSTVDESIDFVYEGDFTAIENGSRQFYIETEAKTYLSEDTYAGTIDDDFIAPLDLLNSIIPPSLPPHELTLKRGAIVMLLRNLDVDQGECNGSRMRVINLGDHILECELLSGEKKGERLFLPRLKMEAQDTMLPKKIIRLQFPVGLAYAITINKSQGQTLDRFGICLRRPCFTHGQLYVAFSRVGHIDGINIFIEDSGKHGTFKFRGKKCFTSNVVFRRILAADCNDINQQQRRIIIDLPPTQQPVDSTTSTNVPPPLLPRLATEITYDGNNSDPDYRSEESDAEENQFPDDNSDDVLEQIDLNNMNRQNDMFFIHQNSDDFVPDNVADEIWPEDTIPFRTERQLLARVAIQDRPGTSGLNVPTEKQSFYYTFYPSEDDSD
ncbi:hypothetical protein JTB14_024437 [Gonioctena quinquepunctata]|nr:hypothetical protein JTB14_024437 [Gonioctena quinquepunctata]